MEKEKTLGITFISSMVKSLNSLLNFEKFLCWTLRNPFRFFSKKQLKGKWFKKVTTRLFSFKISSVMNKEDFLEKITQFKLLFFSLQFEAFNLESWVIWPLALLSRKPSYSVPESPPQLQGALCWSFLQG